MYKRSICALALFFNFDITHAASHWQSGKIWSHSSTTDGLLIRFNPQVTPMPENCTGATWFFIAKEHKTMIATTLMTIATNNLQVTVYSDGLISGTFCNVIQVHPESST